MMIHINMHSDQRCARGKMFRFRPEHNMCAKNMKTMFFDAEIFDLHVGTHWMYLIKVTGSTVLQLKSSRDRRGATSAAELWNRLLLLDTFNVKIKCTNV
jgi:hypothetical protein